MSLAVWIKTILKKIDSPITQERPIGLKPFNDLSNDEVLNHLAQPIQSTPKFNTSFPKNYLETPLKFNASFYKKAVSSAAPSFVYLPPNPYTIQKPPFYNGYGKFF